MKVGKPKSKRVSVRLRHRIEKASASKQRKQRKEAKSNPQWVSRLKKDPGIPNLFPYKAKVLAEIEDGRRRKEEEAQKRREIAKAQRQGIAVPDNGAKVAGGDAAEDDDEELLDPEDQEDEGEDDIMDVKDESNPMAALLASAQARAQAYSKDDQPEDEEDSDEEEDEEEWAGIKEAKKTPSAQPAHKKLPPQALADPIKAVSALMERMQKTQDGIQRLIEHYQVPALATSGTDLNTRFLVEVARKRGRLGRGGVPNLHAAALTVLTDLNEERLQLPAGEKPAKSAAKEKGDVQIVTAMAQPFRIEGLWGDEDGMDRGQRQEKMVVDA